MGTLAGVLFHILIFPGFLFLATAALLAEYVDRKLCARLQNRVGPPWFQPWADFIKLLAKENLVPELADRPMFAATPLVALTSVVTALMYIPIWKPTALFAFKGDAIVVLYLLSIPTVAFFLGGWYSPVALFHDRRGARDHAALRLRGPARPEHPGAGAAGGHLVAQRTDEVLLREPGARALQPHRPGGRPAGAPGQARARALRRAGGGDGDRRRHASPSTAASCWRSSGWRSASRWSSARRCSRRSSCRSG